MNRSSHCWGVVLACLGLVQSSAGFAQTGSASANPTIRSFTVDQVQRVDPGTELVFRVQGTAHGALTLVLDGVATPIGLPETRSGTYEGAYTISIRDKVRYDSRAQATLRVGDRQATMALGQTLLTAQAQAAAVAAATPTPEIQRVETRNTGALTGGHELSFLVNGTAGGKASVSLDGGKTSIALAEEKPGQYVGSYTVKTRDQFSDATPVSVSLLVGAKTTSAVKPLAAGAVNVAAAVAPATTSPVTMACDVCGVVQAVNQVKVKGKPNYIGAIAGGVAGAALGSQVGKGTGQKAATVVGALGGAVAGREIEKQVRAGTYYDVVVRLDNATTRTVRFEGDPGFKVGGKVKLSGETLVSNE